jgi:hypothetical protein
MTDRTMLENLGMQPEDVNASLAAAGAQAGQEDATRIWWSVPRPPGTRLAAFREDGTEVLPGEPIRDFRGDPAVFIQATRAPGPGHTGKIEFYTRFWTEADARRLHWVTAGQPNTAEVYMTVFDLTVREVSS